MRRLTLLLLVVLVGLVGTASARVIMMPTVPRSCPGGESWDAVAKCLSRYGEVRTERKLPGARLVRLGDKGVGFRVPGLYLYVERGKRWQLGGMLDGQSAPALLDFKKVTISEHEGFRFDVGMNEESVLSFDGETNVPARQQQRFAVFCAGQGYYCSAIRTSCDVFVEGKAYFSFHGKLSVDGDDVVITGDARNAGSACAQSARVELGWRDSP